MPPMNRDGPKTPSLPPELIVRLVETILRIARVRSISAAMFGVNGDSPGCTRSSGIPIAPHWTQP